jgi:beta-glucosidase
MTTRGQVAISATVANTGGRHGATVVQLYVRVNTSGATRPAQQLAGFTRVELGAGESRRVEFTLAAAHLGYTDIRGEFVVDPSTVDAWLSFDSETRPLQTTIRVTGPRRALRSADRVFLSDCTTTPSEKGPSS